MFYNIMHDYLLYRTVELAVSNQRLRDQLRGSQETNLRLIDNVHELTFRWRESQTKLEERERAWHQKLEAQSSKSVQSYQANLTAIFRDVADVKDHFSSTVSSIHKYCRNCVVQYFTNYL